MRGYDSLFEHIARDFDRLAEKDSAKSRHLAKRLHELRLQALQLIRSALQDGLFPEFRGFLENLRPLFARNPLLPSDAPDWSEPLLVWVHHVISFVGQRFPGRIPDGFGLYAVHTEPGLCRVETHPPGTPIPPHLAEFWRKEGYPQNTKALRRNSIRIEDSYDDDDWVDRLQREAKSDAAICRVLAEISSPDREKGVNEPSDDTYKSVRDANESWVLKLTTMLRALPNDWDDRRGQEFDCLTSDERAAIQGKRLERLSIAGKLLIKAILDHGWLPNDWLFSLVDEAKWARDGKLYERRAVPFLGMFVARCLEYSSKLPPSLPPLVPLKCHHTGFRPEDTPRADFVQNCEAIAWLIEATAQPVPADRGSGSAEGGRSAPKTNTEMVQPPGGAANDEGANPAKPTPVPKRPSDDAFKAWRLRDLTGLKRQQDIADRMSKELRRKVHQGEVSRWLKEVDEYRKAGGIFPDLPGLSGKPQSVDPAVLELGERVDHRTPRQRTRRRNDSHPK